MNLEKYLNDSLSWEQYVAHIKDVIENGDKEKDTYEYYPLNLTRIERLLKKIELSDAQKEKLATLDREVILVEITEGWCGDASQILPVVENIVEESDKLTSRIVLRDSNDLIENYLTNGGKAIPIIVGVDKETKEELFKWGPRPEWAADILKDYKSNKIDHDEFVIELQKKYNKDKGNAIIEELLNILTD